MHVQGDVDEVLADRTADLIPLFIGGVLEQFLAKVVSEGICGAIVSNE